MNSGPGFTAIYSPENMPLIYDKGNGSKYEYMYSPNNRKYLEFQVENGNHLIQRSNFSGDADGRYEVNYSDWKGIWFQKHYIMANGKPVAIWKDSINIPAGYTHASEVVYLHHDNLGSLSQITDASGQLKSSFSYDAWGKRRNPETWSNSRAFDNKPFYDHGFTGHKSLDDIGLVDMKGRFYNPTLGSFLSADPKRFQMPSWSAYSYCFDNPTSFIDPDGNAPTYYQAAQMANYAYAGTLYTLTALPGGWMPVRVLTSPSAISYRAVLFERTDSGRVEGALAFAGTYAEGSVRGLASIGSNVLNVFGLSNNVTAALGDAAALNSNYGPGLFTFIGHSQGANAASVAAVGLGRNAINFNPAPTDASLYSFTNVRLNNMPKSEMTNAAGSGLVVNIIHRGDPLYKHVHPRFDDPLVGRSVYIGNSANVGALGAHSMTTMIAGLRESNFSSYGSISAANAIGSDLFQTNSGINLNFAPSSSTADPGITGPGITGSIGLPNIGGNGSSGNLTEFNAGTGPF